MTAPCRHWDAAAQQRCGATPARLYAIGARCTAHTPAAIAGQPEPPAGVCAPNRRYCTPGNHCDTCARHQPTPQAAPDRDALFTQQAVAHA